MNATRPLPDAAARPAGRVAGSVGLPPRWPVDSLHEALGALLPGLAIEVLAEVDSTNSELMRRSRAGRLEPALLVGERQTAGRGRLGRLWDSGDGHCLTFSLGLPLAPPDWSGLSLAVGVGLAEALDPRIRLKWPNDLWLDDRKLAGILIETAMNGAREPYAVVGVGINLAERPVSGLATPPAWLAELRPDCAPGAVLLDIAVPLVQAIQRFERDGFAAFKPRFDARDALRDRPIVLSDGTCGIGRGTTAQGALRVQTDSGFASISSAEVSVRPRP